MSAALFKKAKQKALYLAILGMFSNNVPGLVLDANDWGPTGTGGTGVVFQDLSGTAVTAMEQPVQLILDKSQGLAQTQKITNIADRTFTSDTGFWAKDAGVAIGGGAATFTSAVNTAAFYKSAFLTSGKTYLVTVTVQSVTSGGVKLYCPLAVGTLPTYSTPGTYTAYIPVTGATSFGVQAVGTTTAAVSFVSCQQIAGNHAYVSASANRPVITARYNEMIKTENLSVSPWSGSNAAGSVAAVALPPNVSAAGMVTASAGAGYHVCAQISATSSAAGASVTQFYWLRKGTTRWGWIGDSGDAVWHGATIDFDGATITEQTNGTATIVGTSGSWFLVKFVYTRTRAGANRALVAPSVTATTGGTAPNYTAAGTETVYATGIDSRPSDQATGLIPTYQRVNTATDYDTVGFPVREAYNGSNQLLGGASGGGATTGFFFCAGVMITKVGAAQTLFSDTGTNTGWRVRINASNQLELSAGNGTTYTTVATVGTVSINKLTVVTAWHDGTNLNVQINQGAVAQAAFAVATAGTAGYTLACDNGASTNYLQGSLGEIVYRTGTAMTAAQIASTQAFVNSKQKAY